jgi:hypothetical protein
MTQKALNFVVSGMLNSEREITEKRIAYILSTLLPNDAVDGFTDGFVVGVKWDDALVFDYARSINKSKVLNKLNKITLVHDGLVPQLSVEMERTVWHKPGTESWKISVKKTDEDMEETIVDYTESIPLYPDCNIPGVTLEIL